MDNNSNFKILNPLELRNVVGGEETGCRMVVTSKCIAVEIQTCVALEVKRCVTVEVHCPHPFSITTDDGGKVGW